MLIIVEECQLSSTQRKIRAGIQWDKHWGKWPGWCFSDSYTSSIWWVTVSHLYSFCETKIMNLFTITKIVFVFKYILSCCVLTVISDNALVVCNFPLLMDITFNTESVRFGKCSVIIDLMYTSIIKSMSVMQLIV